MGGGLKRSNAFGAVNGNAARGWMNQPAELATVGHVLCHLQLDFGQPVAWGAEFDDEFRTNRQETLLLGFGQLCKS